MPLAIAWVNILTFSHHHIFVSLRYRKCHGGHGSLAVYAILFLIMDKNKLLGIMVTGEMEISFLDYYIMYAILKGSSNYKKHWNWSEVWRTSPH